MRKDYYSSITVRSEFFKYSSISADDINNDTFITDEDLEIYEADPADQDDKRTASSRRISSPCQHPQPDPRRPLSHPLKILRSSAPAYSRHTTGFARSLTGDEPIVPWLWGLDEEGEIISRVWDKEMISECLKKGQRIVQPAVLEWDWEKLVRQLAQTTVMCSARARRGEELGIGGGFGRC
ncbi:MAG: hypothetical protein ASARMPREDX12_001051 [Alectoria sarmentosa]|nr:MAG: hypothetical protein ASARMPREDX12_001051 [Alectoria sarmentosa]